MIRVNITNDIKRLKDTRFEICENEVARICTECPLPASACNRVVCKRYNEKMKELRSKYSGKKRIKTARA